MTFTLPIPTYDEWLAMPLAHGETGSCPNCGGRHHTIVHPVVSYSPGVYRCLGTEWPNPDGYEFRPSCGAKFRGRPGDHYNEEWFAVATVGEFVRRHAQ